MEAPVLAAIIAGSVATVASIITAIMSAVTLKETKRNNRRVIGEARRQKRKDSINQSLNEFYGPLQAYLQVSKALSRLLFFRKPKGFRTLTYLLDPTQAYDVEGGKKERVDLSDSDKVLLKEIIEIGSKIEELILAKGGLVDDQALMFNYVPDESVTDIEVDIKDIGLLSLAIAHFRVIGLANEGKLHGDVESFRKFVFPRELPVRLIKKIESLQDELKRLESSNATA